MKIPKIHWIEFNMKSPPIGLYEEETFLVLIKEYDPFYKCYIYSIDIATPNGSYISGFWDTQNDWDEGQKVEVIAYARFPTFVKEEDLIEVD